MKVVVLSFILLMSTSLFGQVKGVENYKRWHNANSIIHGFKGFVFEPENRHHKLYWYAEGRTQNAIQKIYDEAERILVANGMKLELPETISNEGLEAIDLLNIDEVMSEVVFYKKDFSLTWLIPDQHSVVKQDWMLTLYIDEEGSCIYVRSTYDPFYAANVE